ncbi:MAG: ribonuclease [Thermoleophilaceae bacterium]|nr:ribonuclease [Thermoleophilaceae bacterium]
MKVPPDRRDALRAALEQAGALPLPATGTGEVFRYSLDGAAVTLWRTGTVRVTGKGEGRAVLEPLVEAVADASTPALPVDLPRDVPWAGVDESGKGDYFGPLVSAAAYVAPDAAQELRSLGVVDSKRLSDGRVAKLEPAIRELVVPALTVIAPPRYNDLYASFRRQGRRLNDLLAWAHARSIEDLLEAGLRPGYAIVDQFADARVVEGRLMAMTRSLGLRVVQFPRAEADVAVAAASILARKAFLDWLDRHGGLPKGAGPAVEERARQIVASGGEEALGAVAKLHFATTERVLGPSAG